MNIEIQKIWFLLKKTPKYKEKTGKQWDKTMIFKKNIFSLVLVLMISYPIFRITTEVNHRIHIASNFSSSHHISKTISYKKIPISRIHLLRNNIENYISKHIGDSILPGACFLMFTEDTPLIVINKNFSPLTPISLASVTKTFTALLILKLQEEGKLNIIDPISQYFSVYQHYQSQTGIIRIRDLMKHTSGIPYYANTIQNNSYIVAIPIYKVGTYRYSNFNYILLSEIATKITQKTYPDLIYQYIIQPYHLKHSRVSPYSNGSAGIISNAYDLIRFQQVLLQDFYQRKNQSYLFQMMQPEISKQYQFKNHSQTYEYYGLGLHIKMIKNQILYLYHSGTWNGTSNFIMIIPEWNLTVAFTSNPPDYHPKKVMAFRAVLIQKIESFLLKQIQYEQSHL